MKRIVNDEQLVLLDGQKEILRINEIQEQNVVKIKLDGSLRSETAYDFQDELTALAILGMDLQLDFEKVTYLSAACVQVMLKLQQKMDDIGRGTLTLVKLPETIYAELQSTGTSELLMIEE